MFILLKTYFEIRIAMITVYCILSFPIIRLTKW